jgi:hypothetical protein
MKGRTGAGPKAVRDGSGKFRDVRGYRRADAGEVHHVSAARVGARLDKVEKRVLRARDDAIEVARSSMQEAVTAFGAVRSSMKEAVSAVRRATRNIARRVSTAAHAARPSAKSAKRTARKATRGLAAD